MRVLARTSCALAMYAAIAGLAGCAGGSGTIGSAGLPAERGIAPLGSKVTAIYTVLHKRKPFKGAEVWLRKCDPNGAYIRWGKTNAMGKVEWSGFNTDQYIELGFRAKVMTKTGWQFREWKGCWLPGKLPLKDTFRA
jgi:hypothetical protein